MIGAEEVHFSLKWGPVEQDLLILKICFNWLKVMWGYKHMWYCRLCSLIELLLDARSVLLIIIDCLLELYY